LTLEARALGATGLDAATIAQSRFRVSTGLDASSGSLGMGSQW
jgi:hypothetical protein